LFAKKKLRKHESGCFGQKLIFGSMKPACSVKTGSITRRTSPEDLSATHPETVIICLFRIP
jgi:hypothetical protein